jgi:hypothetical protein
VRCAALVGSCSNHPSSGDAYVPNAYTGALAVRGTCAAVELPLLRRSVRRRVVRACCHACCCRRRVQLITGVVPGSAASRCPNLRPGMVVLNVNDYGNASTSYADLLSRFASPPPLCVTFHDPLAVDKALADAAKDPHRGASPSPSRLALVCVCRRHLSLSTTTAPFLPLAVVDPSMCVPRSCGAGADCGALGGGLLQAAAAAGAVGTASVRLRAPRRVVVVWRRA